MLNFEEYCEIRIGDPSDDVCRNDYLDDLRRAQTFKRFITKAEIRSFPFIIGEKKIINKMRKKKKELLILMNQKFVLELNASLAMENAGIELLQTRIEEVSLPEAKQRLEHHLQVSLQHQKILQQLISNIGGQPTQAKLGLPLPSYTSAMRRYWIKL